MSALVTVYHIPDVFVTQKSPCPTGLARAEDEWLVCRPVETLTGSSIGLWNFLKGPIRHRGCGKAGAIAPAGGSHPFVVSMVTAYPTIVKPQ